MKLYIIAGEASGDLHGSNLVKQLNAQQSGIEFRGWGGDLMTNAGVEVVKHYRDLAFMGFVEVLQNIRTILRNMRFCKADVLSFQPDALVLIDYPGFNMRIARWAHEEEIPVLYYIAPQTWAWKENRVHAIKKHIRQLYVVLPFEVDYFAQHGIAAHYSGHPLLDQAGPTDEDKKVFIERNGLSEKPIIALLPGSRKQEIHAILPTMAAMQNAFPNYQFIIGGAPGQLPSFYTEVLSNLKLPLIFGQTQALLKHAKAGLVTSGTATLEAGIYQLPQVVCYKGSAISYAIARRLLKIKYISLVNLILNRKAVTELIQHDFNEARLNSELHNILDNELSREKIAADYSELHSKLGGAGASARTATHMLKILGEIQKPPIVRH